MAQSQSDTKFLHFREIDERGNVNPRGGLTVAYRPVPSDALRELFQGFEGSDSDTYVEYAQAVCHENDNFVKALGRAKSGGRLQSRRHTNLFVGGERDFVRYVEAIATEAGATRKFSRKARK